MHLIDCQARRKSESYCLGHSCDGQSLVVSSNERKCPTIQGMALSVASLSSGGLPWGFSSGFSPCLALTAASFNRERLFLRQLLYRWPRLKQPKHRPWALEKGFLFICWFLQNLWQLSIVCGLLQKKHCGREVVLFIEVAVPSSAAIYWLVTLDGLVSRTGVCHLWHKTASLFVRLDFLSRLTQGVFFHG